MGVIASLLRAVRHSIRSSGLGVIDKVPLLEETGLEVLPFADEPESARHRAAPRPIAEQVQALQRLTRAFVENPDTILQELVNAAVELCGADSAGISLERGDRTDEQFYHWAATAGQYSGFLDAMLPRYPSACGICLDRGEPQRFRVNQKFFDILGVAAPLVTDGLLLPWHVGSTRGTIFVMAHTRRNAFDMEDCRTMTMLSDFAAMAVRQQRQQTQIVQQTRSAAGMAMAHELAHRINNPLQGLTNLIYLAANGSDERGSQALAQDLSPMLDRLSTLVTTLLALPASNAQRG
jgi:transcriptional regulator with GAF, ATPase, and Fis domain